MAEKKDALAPIGVLLRIQPGSSDPRHQKLHEWYESQPRGPAGRKTGIQTRIIDLIVAGIEAGDADPVGAPPKKKARRKPAGQTSSSQKPHVAVTSAERELPGHPPSSDNAQRDKKAQAESQKPPSSSVPATDKKRAEEARTLMRDMKF